MTNTRTPAARRPRKQGIRVNWPTVAAVATAAAAVLDTLNSCRPT